MKKLLRYLPLHFLLFLVCGIYTQYSFNLWNTNVEYLAIGLTLLSIILFVLKSKIVRTICSFLLFFLLGISLVFWNDATKRQNYFAQFANDSSLKIVQVTKVLKSNLFYNKYEVAVLQIDNNKTSGKVLLNVAKDSISNRFQIDDVLATKSNFYPLSKARNPYQFDYKEYLRKRGIHQQISCKFTTIQKLNVSKKSLLGITSRFRNEIQRLLKQNGFKDDVFGVISALLLGQRNEISNELITNYSKAGAIHILAVSGLHVGIILLLLSYLFKPIEAFKNGKLLKAILIILILWIFAFIAGLSASVVRAVTMFTFVSVGLAIKAKHIIEHSLITSMFALLVFNPMFLYDVGFQMSYLAVFGIIWFQPIFYKLWKPNYKLLNKIWQLITVSTAAQLGVLPLSLFYFHQFPGLFFISNLIIVPFLGIILLLGILIIGLSLVNLLPSFLVTVYDSLIQLMNLAINTIADKESFLIQDIPFSKYEMLFSYLFILMLLFFLRKQTTKRLFPLLAVILLIQSLTLFDMKTKHTTTRFLVFHKSRQSMFGVQQGNRLTINTSAISNKDFQNTLSDFITGASISKIDNLKHNNIIQVKDRTILVVDSLAIYAVKQLHNPIVLLKDSPKINLERLIKTITPTKIIADGSNYNSYVNLWKRIAEKHHVPYYSTRESGVFIENIKD